MARGALSPRWPGPIICRCYFAGNVRLIEVNQACVAATMIVVLDVRSRMTYSRFVSMPAGGLPRHWNSTRGATMLAEIAS